MRFDLARALLWSAIFVSCLALARDSSGQSRRPLRTLPGAGAAGEQAAPPSAPADEDAGIGPGTPMLPSVAGTIGGLGERRRQRRARDGDERRWVYWWEFNRDRFLRSPRRGLTNADGEGAAPVPGADDFFRDLRPSADALPAVVGASQVADVIRPALIVALKSSSDRELTIACLLAIGKTEQDRRTSDPSIVPVVLPYLRSNDIRVSSAAALALGIARDPAAFGLLLEIIRDSADARTRLQRDFIRERTRVFAIYGLGVAASRVVTSSARDLAFSCLDAMLRTADARSVDLRVAAVSALGTLDPDWSTSSGRLLAQRVLRSLMACYSRDLPAAEEVVQAHAARSIAALLSGAPESSMLRRYARARFVHELMQRRRRGRTIRRATVLALGSLGEEVQLESSPSFAAVAALWQEYRERKDSIASHFALIALGQHGGAIPREWLLKALRRGSKIEVRPWAALGLGLLACGSTAPSPIVVERLREAMRDSKSPDAIAACAIGLGLSGDGSAKQQLRSLLVDDSPQRDLIAGCAAVALALVGDQESCLPIGGLVGSGRVRLQRRAAFALGALHHRPSAALLTAGLRGGEDSANVVSLAAAIGQIADGSAIDPLIRVMNSPLGRPPFRAMAAAALGDLANRDDAQRWNVIYSADVSYLSTVVTLHDGAGGILDLL